MSDPVEVVHWWDTSSTVKCGIAPEDAQHACRYPDGNPPIVNFTYDSFCPMCGKPLCQSCKLIAQEP